MAQPSLAHENLNARGILVQGSRTWQVVAPSAQLLDLSALAESLGEPLVVLPPEADVITSAIPGAEFEGRRALPIVDAQLLNQDAVDYESGSPGNFRRLNRSDLPEQLMVLDFCQKVLMPDNAATSNQARIESSITEFTNLRIRKRLDETLHIPPLPDAARRILALKSDPNSELKDLVAIIETDPSLAARLLGWANSAFYHADPPATSIHDAIMRVLGFDLVMNMALGMVMSDPIRLPKADIKGIPNVWLEAVATAATCEALSAHITGPQVMNSGLAYLLGLLANFGTLVLGHVFPPYYQRVRALQSANRHLPVPIIDEYVLKLPREILAAELLRAWALPEEIVTAIEFQNTRDYEGPHQQYVALLRLAKLILADVGLSSEPLGIIDRGLLDSLNTDATIAAKVKAQVLSIQEDLRALAQMLDQDA